MEKFFDEGETFIRSLLILISLIIMSIFNKEIFN